MRCWISAVLVVVLAPVAGVGAEPALEARFDTVVKPFVATYCQECHCADKAEARLNLSEYQAPAAVARDHQTWAAVLERLEAREMPPEDASKQPTEAERKTVAEWIRSFREAEAERTSGDPGLVLARRLSNAEFDNTIRDLTGVDLRPTKEFPVDPANEAGFDNSGESLAMSPALLKKYLAAARHVADHVVFKPEGLVFAPHPVVTDTDRDKYCVYRIVDFYNRHSVDYVTYFLAAWRYQHRQALGLGEVTLAEMARESNLSEKYLALLWTTLTSPPSKVGPLPRLARMFRELPAPDLQKKEAARPGCERMRDFVTQLRKDLWSPVDRLHIPGVSDGSQPLVLWRNRQYAEQRMTYAGDNVMADARRISLKLERPEKTLLLHFVAERASRPDQKTYVVWRGLTFQQGVEPPPEKKGRKTKDESKPETGDRPKPVSLRDVLLRHAPEEAAKLNFGKHPLGHAIDADSFVMTVPATLTVNLPAEALYTAPEVRWTFIAEGAIDGEHSGSGGVRVDVTDWIPVDTVEEAVAQENYLARKDDPAFKELEDGFHQFCRVFPDRFVLYDRFPYFENRVDGGSGRLLTAGFHLMQGYFRDDRPLYELVLTDAERAELDQLWWELEFLTGVTERQYKDFIFFERAETPRTIAGAEYDFARAEDKDAVSPGKMKRLAEAYVALMKQKGASGVALEAVETYFKTMSEEIQSIEAARQKAEPRQVESLLKFAQRAWRRPVTSDEERDLLAFRLHLIAEDGATREAATRETLASILLSPHFLYRFDLAQPGDAPRPLNDYELASRLSYFLWSSMPDQELLDAASMNALHHPEALLKQTRRMLRDPKVRGLATEFAGNWLDVRRFEEHNAVDRDRFPQFTSDLRQAMFEEPIRFFLDVAQHNRPVHSFLEATHTFVNPVLAKHYGMPAPPGGNDVWVRVDNAREYGRGGLLPMSVFLTKNAPGLRTSPVKRGYWVVRRLLGEHIPAPPPEVPELPKDEAQLGELTLPQVLAKHRDHKACAACHVRFDSIGLAFEGFGPIGERRDVDLGGRPVQSTGTFPDGVERQGLEGLRQYLQEKRQADFEDNFCRKLLAYALGRSLQLSDQKTLVVMRARMTDREDSFGGVIEAIVTSPQFLNKRGDGTPSP